MTEESASIDESDYVYECKKWYDIMFIIVEEFNSLFFVSVETNFLFWYLWFALGGNRAKPRPLHFSRDFILAKKIIIDAKYFAKEWILKILMHCTITSKRSKCCRSCSNLEVIDECKMCRIRKYIYFVSLSGHLKYRYADIEMSDKYIKFYNHTYNIFSVSYNKHKWSWTDYFIFLLDGILILVFLGIEPWAIMIR